MRYSIFFLLLLTGVTVLSGQSTAERRSKIFAAVDVIEDFTALKEQRIPASMLALAEGLVIIPGLKKAGFVVAGKRGKGVAIVRDEAGNWSYPAFVTLTGGSFGFQVGVQSTDLVLIIRDRETLTDMGTRKFTLGGDASITAGPLGRDAGAATDGRLDAAIYSYSRSKGLFAGLSLEGAALKFDEDANEIFYRIVNPDPTDVLRTELGIEDQAVDQLREAARSASNGAKHK